MIRAPSWQRTAIHLVFTLWLGGFTFYAAVVIPTAAQVLGSHTTAGFITQRVSFVLNGIGIVLLCLMAWQDRPESRTAHSQASPGQRTAPKFNRLWYTMVLCQITLVGLHPWVGSYLNAETQEVIDQEAFYSAHRIYLLTATVLWCAGVLKFRELLHWTDSEQSSASSRG